MSDKLFLEQLIQEHYAIFPGLYFRHLSVTADKGYYSYYNQCFIKEMTGNADGIQRPANVKDQVSGPQKQELFNRRAGIEPLIGHLKNNFGLGKSRMKSDRATHSAVYRSVTGFNLHQLVRCLEDSPLLEAA